MWNRYEDEEVPVYKEGQEYTKRQLELMADQWLRDDARAEMCRKCGGRGLPTGHVRSEQQFMEDGKPLKDTEGHPLVLDFPEYQCDSNHTWYQGEGEARGIGGDHPILFEEHMQSRRRREIFPANGIPDPSIVAGLYNRSHPQGRKINSPEQRARNGASYYRG